MSGDIPLSVSSLEKIVEVVAVELLEQWAINSFMNYFNEALLTAKTEKPSLII